MLKLGAAIVLGAALAAIIGPSLTPFDPAAQDLALRLAGPSSAPPSTTRRLNVCEICLRTSCSEAANC